MNAAKAKETELSKCVSSLIECLDTRFSSFQGELFQQMKWVDPANWQSDTDPELETINNLAKHFAETLDATGNFDQNKIKVEWKNLKLTVKNYYKGWIYNVNELWEKILSYKEKEFPNLCQLVRIILAIDPSNSSVER